MNSLPRLRLLFGTLVPLALGAVACGDVADSASGASSGGGSSGGTPVFAESVCAGSVYEPLTGLSLPSDAGSPYLELRRQYQGAGEATGLAVLGEPCTAAADVLACRKAIAAASAMPGFDALPGSVATSGMLGPSSLYLVVERAGVVTTVSTEAELATFLGPIDTAKEAALLAHLRSYQVQCGSAGRDSTAERRGEDWLVSVESGSTCGKGTHRDANALRVTTDGTVTVESTTVLEAGNSGCAEGRRPKGLLAHAAAGPRGTRTLGELFAEQAHFEAASVEAFQQIVDELVLHGAPSALVRRARRAKADEVRHAVTTTALAARFGAAVRAPRLQPTAARSLFELAKDNAVEGCVRETYGALVAEVQAKRASDLQIANAMRDIAREETMHAAFSWDLAAWAEARLTASEKRSIRAAQSAALADLEESLGVAFSSDVQDRAGMPTPMVARSLLAGLEAALFPARLVA